MRAARASRALAALAVLAARGARGAGGAKAGGAAAAVAAQPAVRSAARERSGARASTSAEARAARSPACDAARGGPSRVGSEDELFAAAEDALHLRNDPHAAVDMLRAAERAAGGATLRIRSRLCTALAWAGDAGGALQAAREGEVLGLFADARQRPGVRLDTRLPSAPFPLEAGVVDREGYHEVRAAVELVEKAAERLLPRVREEHARLAHAAPEEAEGLAAPGVGKWTHLSLQDLDESDGVAELPATTGLVRLLLSEGIRLTPLRVRFSTIEAGTHIRTHCGPTNRRWTMHIGIDVPRAAVDEGRLFLEVGGERRAWRDGRVTLFDDSFEHSVVFDARAGAGAGAGGAERRTVLHVDFVHPGVQHLPPDDG